MRRIQDLYISGMKIYEIAQYIGKSQRSVYRDLADVKELNRAMIMEVSQDDILGREIRFLEELRRKTMRECSLCREGDNARIGYLRTALAVHTHAVNPITTAIVTAPRFSCPMLNEIKINNTMVGITVKRLVMNIIMSSTRPPI